jgi:hypothetical protein
VAPSRDTYTAPVSDATDKPAAKLSLRKSAPKSAPVAEGPAEGNPASKPRQVQLAAGALVLSGITAIVAALTLFGQKEWLTRHQITSNNKEIANAGKDAIAKATKEHLSAEQIAAAGAKARAKSTKDLSNVAHQVSQQQRGALISAFLVLLVMVFLAYGVYRGRHWSRWGVSAFWLLASFTGTTVGLFSALSVGADLPGAYKAAGFVASVLLILAVVCVNMRVSTQYFALSRPVPPAGAPPRRGLFGPRPAPRTPRAGAEPRSGAKGVLTSNAAERGEAYVERQRSKKRASANADSVARGAELARSRAKASKSRRVER